MPYSPFIARGTCPNFQRLNRRFLPGLQKVWQVCVHPPVTPSFGIVSGRNIHESCFESLSHPLSGAMRNIELSTDLLKAEATSARSRI